MRFDCGTWRGKWQPTPVFLPGEFHGQRSLVGYSPRGCKESVVLEKTLESPLDIKEIKPANFKGNQPEYSLEALLLKLKL